MHDQRNAYWEYRIETIRERKEAVPGFAGHPVQQRRKCQTADGLRQRKSILPRPRLSSYQRAGPRLRRSHSYSLLPIALGKPSE